MAPSRRIHTFSVIPRLSDLVKDKLPDVEVIEVKLRGQIEGKYTKVVYEEEIEELQEAEVLLVDNNLLSQITHRLPKLQWAQGTWAGVEGLVDALKDKPKPSFPITRMVGDAFSQLLSEYTIGWIISYERRWLEARENQLKSKWAHTGKIAYYRSLQDMTVGVLGMGNIGKEVARSLKSFRSNVHAYTRTPPTEENRSEHVDKYWHTDELSNFLQNIDYIVNIMPSTAATRGLLGGDTLKDAKKDAVLINIGRGDVISETDIIKALDVGWISGAILDVFSPEPLRADSPLWKHPKVITTPHVAAVYVHRGNDVVEVFCQNYKDYMDQKPIKGIVNFDVDY